MNPHRFHHLGYSSRRSACLAFLTLLCMIATRLPALPHGQHHSGRRAIDQLEDRWREAMVAADVSTLNALLANDYMGITATGTLQSRDDVIHSLTSGATHFNSIEVTDRKVRFYGSTALVTCRAEISGTGPAGDLSGSYRYTHVYAHSPNGSWQIVSFEASRIHEGEERREPKLPVASPLK
jgi:ketosteroid isomerase-like protein